MQLVVCKDMTITVTVEDKYFNTKIMQLKNLNDENLLFDMRIINRHELAVTDKNYYDG